MAPIRQPDVKGLELAKQLLTKGDCIGMPTETVYGLAGNAFDETAVLRTFTIKERPLFDPLIVHISENCDSIEKLSDAGVIDMNLMSRIERQKVTSLMQAFWPGPLTLLLPRGPKIGDFVTSGLPTVGVRVPAHPAAQALLKLLPFPLSAPSANRFGRVSPTTAQDVVDEFGAKVPLVLDGGRCGLGVESTVLQVSSEGRAHILRPGSLSRERLAEVLGQEVKVASNPGAALPGASPGQMENHYAPSIPLFFAASPSAQEFLKKGDASKKISAAFIHCDTAGNTDQALKKLSASPVLRITFETFLSKTSDDLEAARNLFHALRQAERSTAEVIFCDGTIRTNGLWPAIADRLRKASFKGVSHLTVPKNHPGTVK